MRFRGWRRLLLRRLLATCAAIATLYCALILFAAYCFLHPIRFPVIGTPRSHDLRFEDVHFFSTIDHLKLNGWYIPADGKPRGVILFCHGRQGNRGTVLTHAGYLHRAGFSVMSFDFRASGDSEGDMSTIGGREVGDALGAVEYLRTRPDTKPLKIGIFGVSMGAAVAIQAAARSSDIAVVVADSPFASLDRAVYQRFLGVLGPGCIVWSAPIQAVGEVMMGATAVSISPLKEIPKIAPRPVFLIHGTDDLICNVADSRALFAAAGEPKTLWIVEGAGHTRAYNTKPAEYRRRVTAFFADAFRR